MGSSWPFGCATVLVLVLLSSASQAMEGPDSDMMQKEVDWKDLFDPKELPVEQVMVFPPEKIETLSGREGSRPVWKPRGSLPRILDYPVQFPLSRPTLDNLQAICHHGDRRPQYSQSYFPSSGFGQQKRRASAVNNAESWFRTCCEGNQTWGMEGTLCCATQAWELSVKSFCEEDSSVKDRLYHCCRLTDTDLLNCFNNDSPNPSYGPTEEIPMPPLPSTLDFSFDPNTCQRTVMTQYSVTGNREKKMMSPTTSKKIDINFPPGRPTTDSIDSLCRNQNQRPLYHVKCLPGVGYEWLVRQAKTANRIERGFKQCCKKKQDVLNCADRKWSEELNRFCLVKKSGKVDFPCCSVDGANDRHNCFQNMSSDPHYNMTSATEELSLGKICDTHKIIKKKFPVGFPLKGFVEQCCPLSEEDKNICSVQKLEEVSKSLCSSRKTSPPAVRRCCRMSSQKTPQCISKILTDAITKATKVMRQKKKKRCPLS